jgi:hypothetical protein
MTKLEDLTVSDFFNSVLCIEKLIKRIKKESCMFRRQIKLDRRSQRPSRNLGIGKSPNLLLFSFYTTFKGSLTRDFRLQVFFHESVSPWPLSIRAISILMKIRVDIRNYMFIACVVVSPGINYRRCPWHRWLRVWDLSRIILHSMTPAINYRR